MAMMRIGILAATVLSAAVVVSVPAHADNSSEFITSLSGLGLNPGDTPADVSLTLANAMEICMLIHYGYTPEVAGRQVKYFYPNATPEQAAGFALARP